MASKWFSIDSLLYDKMFSSDQYWLPYILDGKKVIFNFDAKWNLLSYHIEEI